jgi:shikimate dehydrogenase
MIKACVIGWPISHSRSPLIHNYWLRELSIDGSYERVAVAPENLGDFIINLSANGYAGCNVTIPHKELAISAVDHIDASVKAIGALNTIYVRDNKTYATSTDGEGFVRNLRTWIPEFEPSGKNITILGAGGSAKAIIERLLRSDVNRIAVINRTDSRAQDLQDIFGPKIIPTKPTSITSTLQSCDLLINTTSQGMVGQPELEIDLAPLPKSAIVADIVYVPLKTKLLKDADARGLRTLAGLGMLLHQAVPGFELWFGQKPVVTKDLYNLVARDIAKGYQP